MYYLHFAHGCLSFVLLCYSPEQEGGIMRTYVSAPRKWADVYPEKTNHVPTLGQHLWRPHQQGESDANHREGQKCGSHLWNHCGALLAGWEMQKEQWEDRNMGKCQSWELCLKCVHLDDSWWLTQNFPVALRVWLQWLWVNRFPTTDSLLI